MGEGNGDSGLEILSVCIWWICASWQLKKVNEVIGCLNKGNGHKYTLWNLDVHGCVPEQAHRIQKKKKNQRQSYNSFSGHPLKPHLLPGSARKRQLPTGLWQLNWVAELSHCCSQSHLDCFPGGFRMEPSFLLFPEWSRNLHLPGC